MMLLLTLLLFILEEDLDDAMFGKTTRHRPEELKSLERSTKFTRKEIQLIYRGFKQVENVKLIENNRKLRWKISTNNHDKSTGRKKKD